MSKKTINGHEKKVLKERFAGRYIEKPEELPDECKVTVFEKGSDNWWEHGEIIIKKDGKKVVCCGDGIYELDQVEVYLDTRYNHKEINIKTKNADDKEKEKRKIIDSLVHKIGKLSIKKFILILAVMFAFLVLVFYLYVIYKYGDEIYTYSEDAYEYLDYIVDTVIVEGEGLHIYKFPKDVDSYSIEYEGKNIIFKYCLNNNEQEKFAPSASMKITLSNEFKILEKKPNYSSKEQYQKAIKGELSLYAIFFGFTVWVILLLIFLVMGVVVDFKN